MALGSGPGVPLVIKDIKLRCSNNGVPHIVIDITSGEGERVAYSACYFLRTKKWKVWEDYYGENRKIFSGVFEAGDEKSLLGIINGLYGEYKPYHGE